MLTLQFWPNRSLGATPTPVCNGLVSLRGADLTTDLFVSNVTNEVTADQAKTEISGLGVDVVELELLKKYAHF